MDLEQLAILGIAVFSFMAVVNLFSAVRTYKRTRKWQPLRVRRLIGGEESARAMARSIVREIAQKLEDDVLESRQQARLTEPLEDALANARVYYLNRVESIHKGLFSEAVEQIILKDSQTNTRE